MLSSWAWASHLSGRCAEMKRISLEAWQQLVETHRGGPELSSDSICWVCAREQLASIAASSEMEDMREGALAMLETSEKEAREGIVPHEGFFVSKTWLQCAFCPSNP